VLECAGAGQSTQVKGLACIQLIYFQYLYKYT
jgi:hypothetical protein